MLKIDMVWETIENFQNPIDSSCSILTRPDNDSINFEAHKFLNESIGDSLLIKQIGNLLTAILLMKITQGAKIQIMNWILSKPTNKRSADQLTVVAS